MKYLLYLLVSILILGCNSNNPITKKCQNYKYFEDNKWLYVSASIDHFYWLDNERKNIVFRPETDSTIVITQDILSITDSTITYNANSDDPSGYINDKKVFYALYNFNSDPILILKYSQRRCEVLTLSYKYHKYGFNKYPELPNYIQSDVNFEGYKIGDKVNSIEFEFDDFFTDDCELSFVHKKNNNLKIDTTADSIIIRLRRDVLESELDELIDNISNIMNLNYTKRYGLYIWETDNEIFRIYPLHIPDNHHNPITYWLFYTDKILRQYYINRSECYQNRVRKKKEDNEKELLNKKLKKLDFSDVEGAF